MREQDLLLEPVCRDARRERDQPPVAAAYCGQCCDADSSQQRREQQPGNAAERHREVQDAAVGAVHHRSTTDLTDGVVADAFSESDPEAFWPHTEHRVVGDS